MDPWFMPECVTAAFMFHNLSPVATWNDILVSIRDADC